MSNSQHTLRKQIIAAKALRSAVGEDDPELLADMIEGETMLREAIASVLASQREDNIMVVGLDAVIAELTKRKERITERAERKKAAMEQAMTIGEITTLELPEATLSLRKIKPKPIVEDEALIPSKYWELGSPKLNRKQLNDDAKAAVAAKQRIPGMGMDNGVITLTIRRA